MNTNKNSYTLIYAVVMVVVVALLLALVSSGLKDIQNNNVKLDKKKQILSSLNIQLDGQDANTLYEKHIVKELVLNIKGEVVSEKMGDAFVIDELKKMRKLKPKDNCRFMWLKSTDKQNILSLCVVQVSGVQSGDTLR